MGSNGREKLSPRAAREETGEPETQPRIGRGDVLNTRGPGESILRSETAELAPGVWGVRNFHTTLERRSVAGATLSNGYLAMVVVAATMATAGLLLNSAAVVIGSMCVAPFIAPSRAVCIGMLFGNWRVFAGGLVKQLAGLLVIGTGVAIILTVLLKKTRRSRGSRSLPRSSSERCRPGAM